jgi:hypothetical protein
VSLQHWRPVVRGMPASTPRCLPSYSPTKPTMNDMGAAAVAVPSRNTRLPCRPGCRQLLLASCWNLQLPASNNLITVSIHLYMCQLCQALHLLQRLARLQQPAAQAMRGLLSMQPLNVAAHRHGLVTPSQPALLVWCGNHSGTACTACIQRACAQAHNTATALLCNAGARECMQNAAGSCETLQ